MHIEDPGQRTEGLVQGGSVGGSVGDSVGGSVKGSKDIGDSFNFVVAVVGSTSAASKN